MRFIETKTHGYLDYLMGILLIVLPGLMGLDMNSAQSIVPMVIGVMTIVMSLMTAYELSITNIIPMATHLMMDLLAGIVLAASPWIFGFADEIYLPHLILGILEIGASLMTKTKSHITLSTER
ncbi:MAG TPA: SPW repeat protein [Flavobacterium sp.]|jgi:hypothetical protein